MPLLKMGFKYYRETYKLRPAYRFSTLCRLTKV